MNIHVLKITINVVKIIEYLNVKFQWTYFIIFEF